MISKTMIMAAFSLAIVVVSPSLAQSNGGISQTSSKPAEAMQTADPQMPNMGTPPLRDGSMSSSPAPKMTKSQMTSMKKCKAMSPDMMARNKTCANMMKMHPEMKSDMM